MKKQTLFLPVFFLFIILGSSYSAKAQSCDPIDQTGLKELLTQLGYTIKDLITSPGKEKYEVSVEKDGLNVPIGYEISASSNYIWLTVFLGAAPQDTAASRTLLNQNSKIQPAHFYITDAGNLMMGLPVDNRGINNALLKRYTDFIAGKVAETKDHWQQ